MQSMASSICSLVPKVEHVNELASELANTTTNECCMMDQCKDLLSILTHMEGPGGVWCDVDVVEFSYYGASAATPKEEFYTELVDGLRGNYPCIGSGSQVASQSTYGTMGAVVKSRTGNQQVRF